MSEPKKPGGAWPVWLAFALLLLAGYSGSYIFLMRAVVLEAPSVSKLVPYYSLPFCQYDKTTDRILGMIFEPAFRIDRTIRPSFWEDP